MTNDGVLERILSNCSKLSREELLERLSREKRRTGGLISDETLLRMIAAELGAEIENGEALRPTLSIGDLVPSLNNVTVIGRAVAVFSPRAFNRRRSGKFASLLLVDNSGVLRVVLWNDQTELVESGKIAVGQVVRFSHGYTKEGRGGRVELHVGSRCEVEVSPSEACKKEYPTIDHFSTGIGQIAHEHLNREVNVLGTVKTIPSVSGFERQDSSSGKVMRFSLADDTGEIQVVAWNGRADGLEKILSRGVKLQVVCAKVKKAAGDGLELHVDGGSYVEVISPSKEFQRIAELREGLGYVNVEGEVATEPEIREVTTFKGELVKLAGFELKDETGRIWVSAWRIHADVVADLKLGDKIVMKNASVKEGFGEQLELSTKDATSIEPSSSSKE